MAEGTVTKNKKADINTKNGKYSYKYVDIAQVHEYLEEIGARYYQYIEPDANGNDYIMTVPIIDGKELAPRRGCKVVDATLVGTTNPAQQQGSAITYARRYSLLMAFGLATEDDDAQSLSKPKEKANAKPKPAPEPQPEFFLPEEPTMPREVTPEEIKELEQLIISVPARDSVDERMGKICSLYGVISLEYLTREQYDKLYKQLRGAMA